MLDKLYFKDKMDSKLEIFNIVYFNMIDHILALVRLHKPLLSNDSGFYSGNFKENIKNSIIKSNSIQIKHTNLSLRDVYNFNILSNKYIESFRNRDAMFLRGIEFLSHWFKIFTVYDIHILQNGIWPFIEKLYQISQI